MKLCFISTLSLFIFAKIWTALSFVPLHQKQIRKARCPFQQARKQTREEWNNDHPQFDFHSSTANDEEGQQLNRRIFFQQVACAAAGIGSAVSILHPEDIAAWAEEENMFNPKFVQTYSDFTQMEGGWSYRDVTPGKAGTATAQVGDRVVFDWSGYTIGYFGRPFQAKGGPQGGAFDKDLDYERTVLGSGKMVAGVEQGLLGMQPGGVRQIVVPYGALSYPDDDLSHDRVGPKPSTFSGQRALNFVLENPRIDRTLLFNVKVIRVDKPDGRGGFARG